MSAADRLAETLAKMTPGKWRPFVRRQTKVVAIQRERTTGEIIQWGGFDASDTPLREQIANAEGICLLRNEVPSLLAERERLRKALVDAIWAADYLSEQQAMSDDGYKPRLESARAALLAADPEGGR